MPRSAPPSAGPARAFLLRGLLVVGAALASVALLEIGCYAYLRWVPARYNPAAYYLEQMILDFHPLFHPDAGTAGTRFYPYVGFYQEGNWEKGGPPVPSDPDGWVIPQGVGKDGKERYVPREKPAGEIRVIALGGSTMAGMGQTSEEARIPSRLEALLRRAHPDKNIRVVNSGVYTYTATDEMVLFATKIAEFHPDLIVVMDGYNEFVSAYYAPNNPPHWGIFQEYLYRNYKRTQTFAGTLSQLGFLLSKRFYSLAIPRVLLYRLKGIPAAGVKTSASAADAAKAQPEGGAAATHERYERAEEEYFNVLLSILGIARAHDFPIVLALQPNVMYEKPLSPEEAAILAEWNASKPRYSDEVSWFYRTVDGRFDAFRRGDFGPRATLLNLTGLFRKDATTLYADSCHYNDRGADAIARALLPSVEKALRLKPGPAR